MVARLRRGVRERLGPPRPTGDDALLDIEDARLLIARSEGFASWAELVASHGPH
jgi:hypothetical protein